MNFISKTTRPRLGRGTPAGATLDLDFVRLRASVLGIETTLLSLLTTVRTSAAAYAGEGGIITSAPINTPRIAYRPGKNEIRGLLIEGAITNNCLYSNNFTHWTMANGATVAYGALAPDNTLSCSELIDSTSGAAGTWSDSVTVANDSNVQNWSVYLKAGNINKFTLTAALSGGTAVNGAMSVDLGLGRVYNVTGSPITADIEPAANGYFRVQIAIQNNSSGNTAFALTISRDSTTGPGGYFYAWGAQQVTAYRSPSIILTSGATASQASETITVALGSWFNQSYGTWCIEMEFDGAGADQIPFALHDGTFSNGYYGIRQNSGPAFEVVLKKIGQTDQALPAAGATAPGFARAAFAIQPNLINLAARTVADAFVNGQSAPLSLSGTFALPSDLTTLQLGGFITADPANGYLRRLTYFPAVLSAQNLSDLVA